MITLKVWTGYDRLFNRDHIVSLYPRHDRCVMTLSTGEVILMTNSYSIVMMELI